MKLEIIVEEGKIDLAGTPELIRDPIRCLGLLAVAAEILHAAQRQSAVQIAPPSLSDVLANLRKQRV